MKRTQGVTRQRMVVAAGGNDFELAGLVIAALGVAALEEKPSISFAA